MQLSLVAAIIPIVIILWCGANAQDCNYTSFLLNLGYSKECIDSSRSSLISCSNDEAPPYKECCSAQENITTTLMEMKREQVNIANTLTEVKMEQENERKNSDALWEKLEKISNSLSDIKAILQEGNVTNSQSRDIPIPAGTTTTPDGINYAKDLPKNCAELKELGEISSGVRTVYPYGSLNPKQTPVYCDQATDGGGWTVIQSRSPLPVRESFEKPWQDYVAGFGDRNGEYWLGLESIHALTNSTQMELRVELEDWEGQQRWALYKLFHVGDAASKYVLRIGNYSGDTGGDAMASPGNDNANGMMFTTQDNDNDLLGVNCADLWKGAWWFNRCSAAHLNGWPYVGEAPQYHGITWFPFRGHYYSLKKVSMKIRPVFLGT